MSWLKQRIHPLQLRYVAAACALCLAVGGSAAHLLADHPVRTEPDGNQPGCQAGARTSGGSLPKASPLSPPRTTSRRMPAVLRLQPSPRRHLPNNRPAVPTRWRSRPRPLPAEPTPGVATERATVEAPSQGAVLSMEDPCDYPMRIPTGRLCPSLAPEASACHRNQLPASRALTSFIGGVPVVPCRAAPPASRSVRWFAARLRSAFPHPGRGLDEDHCRGHSGIFNESRRPVQETASPASIPTG